ncbi:tetratricopeptide repeat protein [Alicycliphilus denitrificans]|uniref:Tetratricopeptide repeat protein n=1 Tax=Alicycliphilus denitrificans TaxID=179636 RepID=A0A420KFE3_9BURK|nr:tetratricopeptide repeat protein [Alicycliphilus denitrificans]RKJ98658.1 tetratricopeptide repeat protein [Alicycliphilus denitrificans]
MDYYGPMVHPFRRIRPAALACVAATCVFPALAQTGERASEPASAPVQEEEEATAALNAELFYELLLGEITTSEGDPATGYNLMLDAARRSGDPQLYRRATEIALQSRSGEYALAAARAWKEALPQSRDANRYLLRILVALNRIDDSAEPLRQELARSSARDKVSTIRALPLLYARAGDKALAARVVRLALEKELNDPALGPMAWTTVGRMYLAADDKARALEAAGNALGQDPGDDGAAMLSLQLLENAVPEAEALLSRYLAGKPLPEVRMAYARVLLESQRLADAQAQVDAVTREQPDNAQAWLIRASLQLQAGELDQAEAALQRCTQLLEQGPATEQRQRALTQIYLMQSQIAEKRGDLAQAQAWLARIDDAEQLLAVQSRHASLLVRQGRLDEARALIRAIPEKGPDDARLKLQAEVQLLREAGRYQQAYELQGKVVALAPQDNELVYDQAMLADKAGRPAEMERLLRAIIARQPDHHHALNALGFSLADRGVRLQEAKALIVKALEYAPDDPFITDSLGWVEFRLGNRKEALDILERAFRTRPDAEIAAHIGEVLWSLGQRDRALAVWREGLRINKDNDVLKGTLKRLRVRP